MITARAVGRLAMLAELASPLLRPGGALVAWKGERDGDEEAELERAAEAPRHAPGGGSRRRSLRRFAATPSARGREMRTDAGATAAPAGDGEEAGAQGLIRFERTDAILVCRSMREIRPPARAEAQSGHRRRLTAV